MSVGVTPPSSLLRAHASILPPPRASVRPSHPRSVQVAVSPCWEEDLPDVLSAYLSLCAWTPTPVALEVHVPVSSLKTSAFPAFGPGRRYTISVQRLQYGRFFEAAVIHSCSGPQVCSPPRSLLPPYTMWQPWLLRPGLSWFVPSPRPGYAIRPNRAIDGMGTCTPSDTQPCRLLPERYASGAANKWSEVRAELVGRRLHALVGPCLGQGLWPWSACLALRGQRFAPPHRVTWQPVYPPSLRRTLRLGWSVRANPPTPNPHQEPVEGNAYENALCAPVSGAEECEAQTG